MPERILPPKMAVLGLDIRTLFDATLAIANGDLLQSQVVHFEKRPFTLEMLISYNLHYLSFVLAVQSY
jgi:hypothetical protein